MPVCKHEWRHWYNALKNRDPRAYRRAIDYASGLHLAGNLNATQAAMVEQTMVVLACEILNINPFPSPPSSISK